MQIGSDAQFVRPCATCATRVSTPAFYLGDNSIGGFSTPTKTVAYTVTASGAAPGGVIWAQVWLRAGGVAAAHCCCCCCCWHCRWHCCCCRH